MSRPLSATSYPRPDAIDLALGLHCDDPVFALRAHRPEFVAGAEACRRAVLTPEDDLGLPGSWRAAVARRVALSAGNPALLAQYPLPEAAGLADLAEGRVPGDPKQAALAAHADTIALHPARAGAADLQALLAAGFDVPQVIAISELLAFVCFQIRVVHGLGLLTAGAA